MNIRVGDGERVKSYQLAGKKSLLVGDGAVEHNIWDKLCTGSSPEAHDQFVSTLFDPRLSDKKASLESFGSAWKEDAASNKYAKTFTIGDPAGPHQTVVVNTAGSSGNEFTVTTTLPGVVEHKMTGQTSYGEVNHDSLFEEILLP